MPLLLLPQELLLEVIGYVAATDRCVGGKSGSLGAESWDPDLERNGQRYYQDCSPLASKDVLSLIHTCQFLRSLCLQSAYFSVSGYEKAVPVLYRLLPLHPHIATCIRELCLFMPYKSTRMSGDETDGLGVSDSLFLIGILRSCTGLRELRLDGSTNPWNWVKDFEGVLLRYMAPESKRSIVKLEMLGLVYETMFAYLKQLCDEVENGGFGALKMLGIGAGEDRREGAELPRVQGLVWPTDGDWAGTKLESVRSFKFVTSPFYNLVPIDVGTYFATLMPNLQALNLKTEIICIYDMLSTYVRLGAHLTEIKLKFSLPHFARIHLCCIIPKFQKLVKFVVDTDSPLRICQTMFHDGDKRPLWPHLTLLSADLGTTGCDGVKVDELRAGIVRFTQTHPTASVFMKIRRTGPVLVNWDGVNPTDPQGSYDLQSTEDSTSNLCHGQWNRYIAPLEGFKVISD